MQLRRPGRIPGFSYRGRYRYSITACTGKARARLDEPVWFGVLIGQIRQLAAEEQFAVLAYCAMPDHLHLLVEGLSDGSCLAGFMFRLKQRTGFLYRRMTGRSLRQSGYYDRVLRSDETAATVCRYILENPVRAGLASAVGDYPFAGSDVFTVEEITAAAMSGRSQDGSPAPRTEALIAGRKSCATHAERLDAPHLMGAGDDDRFPVERGRHAPRGPARQYLAAARDR